MIYGELNKKECFISDDFIVNCDDKNLKKVIENIVELVLYNFEPQNGEPTIIISEELKKMGFEIKDIKMPIIQKLSGIVF